MTDTAKKTDIPREFCRKHKCGYLSANNVTCSLLGHNCRYSLEQASDIIIEGLRNGTWPGTVPSPFAPGWTKRNVSNEGK